MELHAGPAAVPDAAPEPQSGPAAAGSAGAMLPALALGDPRAVLALQRSVGNAGVGRLLARARIARSPGVTPPAPAVQNAAAPMLDQLGLSETQVAAFYRGELVVGDLKNPGKPSTTVFIELQPDRVRAGIFSINVKADSKAALSAFANFRSFGRTLASSLGMPKLELMGAAVHNPDIGPMLTRLGFEVAQEPLPESMGALPGEKITVEVYKKVFDVKLPAAATADAAPAVTTGPAQQEPPLKPPPARPAAAPSADLELRSRPSAPRAGGAAGGGGGGLRGWGPMVADFGLFLVGNAVMAYGAAKLAAQDQAKLDALIPEIQSRAETLAEDARALQSEFGGSTIWVNVVLLPTYWRVEDAKPYEESEVSFLREARVGAVALGTEYRAGHTEGVPKVIKTNGAWTSIWERPDTLELSFPLPYEPAGMSRDEIGRRMAANERDAARRSELPQNVRDLLAAERAVLIEARDRLAQPEGMQPLP